MEEKTAEMMLPMADKEAAEQMLTFVQSLTPEKNREMEAFMKASDSGFRVAMDIGLKMILSGTA